MSNVTNKIDGTSLLEVGTLLDYIPDSEHAAVCSDLGVSCSKIRNIMKKQRWSDEYHDLAHKFSNHTVLSSKSESNSPVPYDGLSDASARFLLMQAMPISTMHSVQSHVINASVASLFVFDSPKTRSKFTQQMSRARAHLEKRDYIELEVGHEYRITFLGVLRYRVGNLDLNNKEAIDYNIPDLPASESAIGHGFERHVATIFSQSKHFHGQTTNLDKELHLRGTGNPVFAEQVNVGRSGPMSRERRIDMLASPCADMTHSLGIQLKAGHHDGEKWVNDVMMGLAAHSELQLPTVIIVDGPGYTEEFVAKNNEHYNALKDAYPYFAGMFTLTEFMQKLDSEGWSAFE